MTSKTPRQTLPFIPYKRDWDDDFVYPEPGPEAENMEQGSTNRECAYLLENHYSGRPDVLVDDGGELYWDPDDRIRNKIKPDLYVAFGVDADAIISRRAYLIWEVGKAPDFALELASATTHHADTGYKREIYQSIGVGEYWRFDPTGGRYYGYNLAGEILVDGTYRTIPVSGKTTSEQLLPYKDILEGLTHGYSPALELALCVVGGRLRFFDPKTGRFLRSIGESEARADREETARRAAEARADREETARLAAEAELELLRAELRRRTEGAES